MSRLITPVACATLAALLAANAAPAAGTILDPETPQRIVRYADLDIEHAAGAATLYARITIAAQQVCGPQFNTWEMAFIHDTNRCREQSVERAVREVNAPALTRYSEMKSRSAAAHR